MLLRNEESELMQDDVGSLDDADFKSQSHSDDESVPKDKPYRPYSQFTPNRQPINHCTSYGELIMQSPDLQQRHTPYMPVYS